MSNSYRTRVFDPTGKVILAEWVSIHFREPQEHEEDAIITGTITEFNTSPQTVIPRPGEQRQAPVKNTKWRGK